METPVKTPVFVLASLLVLSACIADEQIPSIDPGRSAALSQDDQETIESTVRIVLADATGATFGGMSASRSAKGKTAVCGNVFAKAKDGSGPIHQTYFGYLTGSFYVWSLAETNPDKALVDKYCRDAGVY